MAKRFTDSNKWRNSWFRKLESDAKLMWIYLCDECDFCGVWKADFDLAGFQLGFKVDAEKLINWFSDKVYIFNDCVLVKQFFEFQYGSSKDSWSAKMKAKDRLQTLGFTIDNNKVITPENPLSPHSGNTVLSVGIGKGIVCIKGGLGEKNSFDLESLYKLYPRKQGKMAGLKKLQTLINNQNDFENMKTAISKFCEVMRKEQRPADKVPYFSTFVNQHWRDYLDPDVGNSKSFNKQVNGENTRETNPDEELRALMGGE